MMYRNCFKRIIDFCLSGMALVCLSPLMVVVIILIKLDSEGPVFYLQERVGKDGRLFNIHKFRSMTNVYRNPAMEQTFNDNPEITKVGRIIRRLKIDELPQLIDVFAGDMALVGPRPALPDTYEIYGDIAKQRLSVRPGLSGLSQIRGNIYLPWEQRFEYDREYIENCSLLFDISIIIKTFAIVLLGDDKFIRK